MKLTENDLKYIVSESVKKIVKEATNSNIKRKYINKVYKATKHLTAGIVRDNSWEHVSEVFECIENMLQGDGELEVTVKNGGYGQSRDGLSKYKRYDFIIYLNMGVNIEGVLTCHGAGTEDDPFGRYDMTIEMW